MKAQRVLFLAATIGIGAAGYGCGSSKSTTPDASAGGASATGGQGGAGTTGSASKGSGGHTTTGSSAGGNGPVGSGAGGGGDPGNLAATCSGDADCGAGLKCIKSTDTDPVFGGGPASGYCSKDCKADADCPGMDSTCLTDMNGNGRCLLGCTLGPALMYINDPQPMDKCQGREDLACAELGMMGGPIACIPMCGSDAQCDNNMQCDQRGAVCVAKGNTGKAMGQPCDPKAMKDECAGFCQSFTTADPNAPISVCTSPCVLGGQDLLNQFDCGGIEAGICAFSSMGNGSGDNAICTAACKKEGDCDFPNFSCYGIRDNTGKLAVQNGFCFGPSSCTDAELGNKCKDMMGMDLKYETCTKTTLGNFCLDQEWCLGDFAPNGVEPNPKKCGGGAGGAGGAGVGGAGGAGGAGVGGAGGAGGN